MLLVHWYNHLYNLHF